MKGAVNFSAVVFCFAVNGASVHAAPQGTQHYPVKGISVKDIGRLFENADANRDGVLTREEAGKVPLLSSLFNDMDINQDGKVTYQEMVASMKMKKKHHGRSA